MDIGMEHGAKEASRIKEDGRRKTAVPMGCATTRNSGGCMVANGLPCALAVVENRGAWDGFSDEDFCGRKAISTWINVCGRQWMLYIPERWHLENLPHELQVRNHNG
jgi:hypothetical protein